MKQEHSTAANNWICIIIVCNMNVIHGRSLLTCNNIFRTVGTIIIYRQPTAKWIFITDRRDYNYNCRRMAPTTCRRVTNTAITATPAWKLWKNRGARPRPPTTRRVKETEQKRWKCFKKKKKTKATGGLATTTNNAPQYYSTGPCDSLYVTFAGRKWNLCFFFFTESADSVLVVCIF